MSMLDPWVGYMYMSLSLSLSLYIYVYIYIYTERERESERGGETYISSRYIKHIMNMFVNYDVQPVYTLWIHSYRLHKREIAFARQWSSDN